VPPPAVLELARGWRVVAGGEGELATPTGMALIRSLADECGPIGAMEITSVGVGAGGRDIPGRANVVRVALGTPVADATATDSMWVLETNVDDMDPRVWPTVLAALLEAGAADAWLVPIVMKKGRPAHTLCVLARDGEREALRDTVFTLTSTIGVRETQVSRAALHRDWQAVTLREGEVRIKVAVRAGRIVHATPEFDDAAALARTRDVPVRQVLDEAVAAADAAMLRPGAQWSSEPQDGAAI
jgi:uncharacterized protein (DUF111 family)